MCRNRRLMLFTIFYFLLQISFDNFARVLSMHTCPKDFIEFGKLMKDSVDKNINPCENFGRYACGHIKNSNETKFISNVKYFVKNILEREPNNKAEENIQDNYRNCRIQQERQLNISYLQDIFEEFDTLKSFKSFPLTGNISLTKSDVAKFEAILNSFGPSAILDLTPRKNYTIIVSYNDMRRPYDNISDFIYNKDLQTESGETLEEIGKIENYFSELTRISMEAIEKSYGKDFYIMKSLEELNDLAPSKNFDYTEFQKALEKRWNLDMASGKYKFEFKSSIDHFKDILKLVDSLELKTLVNVQIFEFLFALTKFPSSDCTIVEAFAGLAAVKEAWRNILTSDVIRKYTNFLNDFEDNFNKTSINGTEKSIKLIQDIINKKREILSNYDNIITDEMLMRYQGNYEIGKHYKNIVSFSSRIAEIILASGENLSVDKILNENYSRMIELNIKDKPDLYYYSVINFKLWLEYYRSENPNIDENNSQLPESEYNQEFLNNYNATKSTFDMYSEFMKNELDNCKEFFDPNKIFFISLAQNFCNEQKYFEPEEIVAIDALKSLKEFSTSFECSANPK